MGKTKMKAKELDSWLYFGVSLHWLYNSFLVFGNSKGSGGFSLGLWFGFLD
jgi:hypothetical protein